MREWESNRTKANPQNSQSFLLGISKRERERESEREDGKRYSYSSEECFVRQFWLSSSPYYKTSPSNSKVSLNLMLVKMSFFPYLVSNFLYLFAVCNLPSPCLLVLPFAAFDLLFCFVAGWANDSSSLSGLSLLAPLRIQLQNEKSTRESSQQRSQLAGFILRTLYIVVLCESAFWMKQNPLTLFTNTFRRF